MAQNAFNFFDTDFSKYADFSKFMDAAKMAELFKVPGFDAKAMADSQRKTVEAMTAFNRVAYEGGQAIAQRQTEIVRESVDEAMKAAKTLAEAAPEQRLLKQTELAKESYEHLLANMRELSEIATKANQEALDLINSRVTGLLDEVGSALNTTTAKKK